MDRVTWTNEHLTGFLPGLIHAMNPGRVQDQLNVTYAHGGGWFKSSTDWVLRRPMIVGRAMLTAYGEEFHEVSRAVFPGWPADGPVPPGWDRDKVRWSTQIVILCASDFTAILEENGSFEVARLN